MTDHIDDLLRQIEQNGDAELTELESIERRLDGGSPEYPHPYHEIARLMDEEDRRAAHEGFSRIMSEPLSPDDEAELAEVFMAMGMPEGAALEAARGRDPEAERLAWIERLGLSVDESGYSSLHGLLAPLMKPNPVSLDPEWLEKMQREANEDND